MTKEELVSTVEIVYAMWNKEVPHNPSTLYEAWGRILKDCPKDGILKAAEKLSLTETFLPTPGNLKSTYMRTLPDAPPTAAQAWNEYCRIRDQVNSGTHTMNNIHPRLQATIRQVGLNLSTNDDRRHFTETYLNAENQ